MSVATLIIGKSGTGKTTSLRNLDPEKTLLIQTIKKPLPFRSKKWKMWDGAKKTGSIYVSDKANHMIKCIENAKENGKEVVIIDDFQYQMSNTFMRKALEKGYDKFTNIAKDAWDIIQAVINSDDNIRVYILGHTHEDEFGENIKMKTIGKLLDDKITMEGMFTIVLRSVMSDGQYLFRTQNNGKDTVKSPMGMFGELEIENDLAEIDQKICDYYEITDAEDLLKEINLLLGKVENKEYKKLVKSYVDKNKDNIKNLRSTIEKLNEKINKGS